ncbi:MAG: hypothetical protein ACRDDY_14055 [Clostridium sp.]|uniref:hypothetical protein n=1 Tax=Clostridium sp. TaxID=1506 RepID=UPI003EE51F08
MHIGSFKDYQAMQKQGLIRNTEVFLRFDSKMFEFNVLASGDHVVKTSNASYVNSKFGDWLQSVGLYGYLFISSSNGPSRNADKWIERHATLPRSEWHGDYTIYNILGIDTDHVRSLPRVTLPLNVMSTDKALQEQYGDAWDGFLIRATTNQGLQYFRKMPNRQTSGTIVAVITEEDNESQICGLLVATVRDGVMYHVKAMAIPKWLRDTKEPSNGFVGKSCEVSFTQFVPGDRVSNFTSPRVISISNKRGKCHGTKP